MQAFYEQLQRTVAAVLRLSFHWVQEFAARAPSVTVTELTQCVSVSGQVKADGVEESVLVVWVCEGEREMHRKKKKPTHTKKTTPKLIATLHAPRLPSFETAT
ncbi:hypothetical protein BaRGS_00007304 [Batillaria attramentaria]|uniref:Uncharacterized protein n=1 Tax=Batillaria attramentaria TaxID=370345 RepID=A0ABD0LPN1_9CAEN